MGKTDFILGASSAIFNKLFFFYESHTGLELLGGSVG